MLLSILYMIDDHKVQYQQLSEMQGFFLYLLPTKVFTSNNISIDPPKD